MPHRNWSEPFLLMTMLPADRRIVTVADETTVSRSVWRRFVARQFGGVVPIGTTRSAAAFRTHLEAAGAALRQGAVLAIAPEVGGPSRPPALRRVSAGIGYISAHTDAPIVPMVFGGTDELFLRRRIDIRLLPALQPPPAGVPQREAARTLTAALVEAVSPVAAELHAAARPRPGTRRHWRWLTGRYPRAE